MTSSEATQDLYQQLQEVKRHYTRVHNTFQSVIRTRKPAGRHRHRVRVALKKVRYGIASTERQLQQIDATQAMHDSTLRRRRHEIGQAIASYIRTLEAVENHPPIDDDKTSPEQKPEPQPIPPSANNV